MTFKNLRLFRRGTWADLFLAEVVGSEQTVVIKIFRAVNDSSMRKIFLRELKVVTKRFHSHVLQALCFHVTPEQAYYVMPYFSRGVLTPYAGKMNHEQLRAAAKQICEGIAAMHQHDVIHGDIKPDNLMVTGDGNLQVGDPLGNGAGCTIMYNENSGGTPGYWAPEIAGARGPMSKPGDVFSIGATLYHLATGIRPQDGINLDPWTVSAHVPACIRKMILAATRTNPTERPTAAQLLLALNGNMSALESPSNKLAVALLAMGGLVLVASLFGK
jgi:serine/threonine protein kinase